MVELRAFFSADLSLFLTPYRLEICQLTVVASLLFRMWSMGRSSSPSSRKMLWLESVFQALWAKDRTWVTAWARTSDRKKFGNVAIPSWTRCERKFETRLCVDKSGKQLKQAELYLALELRIGLLQTAYFFEHKFVGFWVFASFFIAYLGCWNLFSSFCIILQPK